MMHKVARGLALCLAVGSLASGVAAEPQGVEHDRRSLAAGTWALETRQSLTDSLKTCDGCKSVLRLLKGILKDPDDSSFLELAKQLCKSGTSYDAQYCDGTIEREAPVIGNLIRAVDVDSKAATEFCVTFLGVCDSPPVDAWAVPFPSRRPCEQTRAAPSGKKPIQVVHYSDIHIDPLYVEGSNTNCDKPTCCRVFNSTDGPGKTKFPAGPNGDHNCDVPFTLEQSMYKAIKDMFPKAAFSLFTGDIIDHGLFNTSKEYNEDGINDAYTKMKGSVKLIYGTAGNHEAHPANIWEPKSVGNDTAWVYETLSDQWQQWIGKSADNARDVGAYSVKYPDGNLRVISLNTNMYYRFNFVLYQKLERDPNGQIAWLVKELDAAERAGENVYILGHMPPGENDCLRDQSNYLDQVFNRYQGTIKAMFFGHTHVDHFEISYGDYQKRRAENAAVVSYICPSLTPTSGMPSFRVYDVDPDTFAVLDATTYMADLSDKSFQSKDGPKWVKYYSAREEYGPLVASGAPAEGAELSPAFWHNVTEALESKTDSFDAYMARKSRGWLADAKCRGDCMKQEICQMRAGRSQDNCFVPKPGVHFSKRDDVAGSGHHEHNRGEHDECGVPVIADVLGALAKREDLLDLLHETFVSVGATLEDEKPVVDRRAESSGTATATATETPTELDCVAATDVTTSSASGTAGGGEPSGTESAAPTSSTGGAAVLGGAAWLAVGAAVMAL